MILVLFFIMVIRPCHFIWILTNIKLIFYHHSSRECHFMWDFYTFILVVPDHIILCKFLVNINFYVDRGHSRTSFYVRFQPSLIYFWSWSLRIILFILTKFDFIFDMIVKLSRHFMFHFNQFIWFVIVKDHLILCGILTNFDFIFVGHIRDTFQSELNVHTFSVSIKCPSQYV